MSESTEERLAHLEESVRELEEAAAREAARQNTGRWIRLAILGAVIAFYAYYLNNITGTVSGL
jgi:hypothetical protein